MACSAIAQVPNAFSYQAVVRDATGEAVENQSVSMKCSILQGGISGNTVYSETHSLSTNGGGLLTTNIGLGIPVSGSFDNISWGTGPYFLKTEIDPQGGSNYDLVSTTQLLSVPYSQFSNRAAVADSVSNNFQINIDPSLIRLQGVIYTQ